MSGKCFNVTWDSVKVGRATDEIKLAEFDCGLFWLMRTWNLLQKPLFFKKHFSN